MNESEEKDIIQYYFHRGFTYEVILDFLQTHHGISISLRTLKRKLDKYGLKRRNNCIDDDTIRNLIKIEIANAGEQSGYRTIWHALRLVHNVHVPRDLVARLLKELDPEASNARRSRKLQRRKYLSPGPNHCWHVDGELKLWPLNYIRWDIWSKKCNQTKALLLIIQLFQWTISIMLWLQ